MNRFLRFLLPLGAVAFLLAFAAGPAGAQKVANPGTFNFKLTNGIMKVKNQEFGFDESQNINFNGTVDKHGAVSIPTISFPSYPLEASGFNLTVKINVVGPTTGTINPLTGAVSLRLKVWIKIDGVPLGGDCRIASSSSPIDLNALVTGTSGSKTGTPYNPGTGTMKIVNASYAVPASSSCGLAAGTVDSTVGLPSPSGQNSAEFNIRTATLVNRAINPALTVTPASGTAPFNTTLSAAGSTLSAGPATYRWDFTNNGSIDQTTTTPTTNHTYTAGGNLTARVQVVDADGDVADATRGLTVNAFPDISITAGHDGDFRVGDPGRYRISLSNTGYAATSGPVTVTAELPPGITYSSVTGTGWSCSAAGQSLTCSRATAIQPGASAPELGIDVEVGPAAYDGVEPSFTVTAAGDNGPGNNTAADPTTVRATDLRLNLSHPSHAMRLGPDPGNRIELSAENVGDAPTSGPTVVTDELPAGLTPVSATGAGWNCEIAGQLVTCTHAAPVGPGATTEMVTIMVDASLEPGSIGTTVNNEATVSTEFDLDSGNDTASDPTLILDGQDAGIVKSHAGNLTAGKPGAYTLAVRNFGTAATTGPTTVVDELPSGLDFNAVDGGPAWQCGVEEQVVTCVHADPIAAGDTAPEITLSVTPGVAAIPEIDNTASVSTPDDPNPANDSSTDPAVVQAIDLEIVKSHEGELRVGRQAVYELAVQNVGDSPTIEPSVVTDQLPAGLDFVAADGGPDWSCAESANTVECEHAGVLEPGQVAGDISLTVEVGPAAAPAVENTATVTTQDDFNLANNGTADTGTVIDIDNAVTISRTGTFRPGSTGTYLISVENIGAVATTGDTVVTTELPAGLELDEVSGDGWTCGEADRTVTCTRPANLGAGTSAPVISLRSEITTAAIPEVSATVTVSTEGDRFPDNDTDTDTTPVTGPDFAVVASHDGSFQVGKLHEYTLEVQNLGSAANAGALTLTDEVPAGFTVNAAYGDGWSCDSPGNTVTCVNPATIGPEEAAGPVTVEVRPTAAALPPGETSATVVNEVVLSTAVDSDPANDSASDPTELIAVDAGLEMTGPEAIAVGDVAEYFLAVTNPGDAVAEAPVRVTHTLPPGFAPRSSGGDDWVCSSAGRKVNCSYGQDLAPGTSAPELTVRAQVGRSAPAAGAENEAIVIAGGDVIPANDTASFTTGVDAAPDLEAGLNARTQAGDKFRVGSDGGYEVIVRNRGSAATTGVTRASIVLPAEMEFLGLDSGQDWTCQAGGSGMVICEHSGTIAPDSLARFTFLTEIGPRASGAVTAEATLETEGDLNPGNDVAASLAEVVRIDLALARSHRPVWTAGGEGSYGLLVTNAGTAATAGPMTITEILPLGATLASFSGEGWTCSVSGRRLGCVSETTLAPGGTSGLEVTLGLDPAMGPEVSASSTVETLDDADLSNNAATEEIPVESGAPPGAAGMVRIPAARTTATRSGVVTIWVECPAEATVKCRGMVSLKSAGKVRLGRTKRARLNLGKAAYAAAPGKRSPVRMTLKKAGRKALFRNRKIRAKVTATNGELESSVKSILIRAGK